MAAQSRYVEVAQHITALGAVKRALTRTLPAECPSGSAHVLSLLNAHGEMRMSRLSELLGIDTSVTSRHVAHAAQRGWLERLPDPADGRSRLLRLTPAGRDLIDSLGDRAVAMIARKLADWSDAELDALTTMLGRLRADFGDCRIPGPRDDGPPAPGSSGTAGSTGAHEAAGPLLPRTPTPSHA